MILNNFKIAFRNLRNNTVFSLINMVSLAIGLSASFVIGAIIYYDLTFDKFHPDGDRIFRVTTSFATAEGGFYNRGVSVPLGQALKEEGTGIETVTTFFTTTINKIEPKENGEVFKNVDDVIFAEKDYFEVFTYQWLAGDPNTALANPNEIVLTQSRAAKYFPNSTPEQIVGNTLTYNDSILVKVTGVVADFDQRTDLYFKEFLSRKTAQHGAKKREVYSEEWNGTSSSTQVFIKVSDTKKLPELQIQLDALAKEHEEAEDIAYGLVRSFKLQPLNDLHFNPDYGIFNESKGQGNKRVLWGLGWVALFLLLLGCINFINLNTAQATKRSKEIGIRKTLGGSKKQLVFQFLGETFLLTTGAALISFILTPWLLQLFSDFIPEGVNFALFKSPVLLISMGLLLLIVTILSGVYPAFVLSHLKPISVLKRQVLQGDHKVGLRKYLTVFQFVIAQVFIIATLLVGKQINYMLTRDMGIKTEAIAYVRTPFQDSNFSNKLTLMEDIRAIPHVSQLSLGGAPPASTSMHSTFSTYIKDDKEINTELELLYGDLDYLNIYDIPLLAGRDRLNDTIQEYVINETYAKILGFNRPEDAVGQFLKMDSLQIPIVGVMKDFNQRSLHSAIKPLGLRGDWFRKEYSQFNTLHFSLEGQPAEQWVATTKKIESSWKTIYPDIDFELQFMDDTIQQFYEQERRTSILMRWATGLAIGISCLGLLGLVIHTTERRTKEIGIRKVLGASLAELNLLLCKEFIQLVGIAFAISVPLAWWGIHYWLQGFAYKTALSWWIFAFSGLAMVGIALLIMSLKIMAAAKTNPVKSLRTE